MYKYSGTGERTRKLEMADTTRYTWDGLYPIVEWTNAVKTKQRFIYANGLLLGLIDSTLGTNKRYFVLHDGLGSSIAFTDSVANIKRSLIYSDFGETLVDTSASNTPTLSRLYAGYSWDGTPTDFYWMKYRQTYDAGIGRFGQEDPILQQGKHFRCMLRNGSCAQSFPPATFMVITAPQLLNAYSYVSNNSTNLIDPTGLGECEDNLMRCLRDAHMRDLECMKKVWRDIVAPCITATVLFCRYRGPQCLAASIPICLQAGAWGLEACDAIFIAEMMSCTIEYFACKSPCGNGRPSTPYDPHRRPYE